MKKNFLQDVIPASQKRSIRDIPLPSHQKKESVQPEIVKEVSVPKKIDEDVVYRANPFVPEDNLQEFSKNESPVFEPEKFQQAASSPTSSRAFSDEMQKPTYKKTKKTNMKKILLGLFIGIGIFLFFLLSKTTATVTVHSKKSTQDISNSIPFDAKNPLVTKTQVTKTVSKTLNATSEKQVEIQASGRIKIVNLDKETPQELIANTRFQTPTGLIYRIKNPIVIPGYTMSGSTKVPGTLEVDVYADKAGDQYNISKTQFTIPGFAGKEQFEKITASSVSDMTGGFVGVRKVVSDDAKAQAEKDLSTELTSQIEQTQNQSTEYILVPDTSTIVYGKLQDAAQGDSITLTLSASADAYSFTKKDLYNFIGQSVVTGAAIEDQFTLVPDSLTFSIEDKVIQIDGSTSITWVTDIEKLKKDIAGKKLVEATPIMDSYKSFEKAEAKISPFWKSKFPSDVSKIEVTLLN